MTQWVGSRRRRFSRTCGFKARQGLDVVRTRIAKTAGRGSRQEIARQTRSRVRSYTSRGQNSIGDGYRRVPDSLYNGGGAA